MQIESLQDPTDGVSMGYTLADANAAGRRKTQFFDIIVSRGPGAQGKTLFDLDFDIDDAELPHQKSLLPKR